MYRRRGRDRRLIIAYRIGTHCAADALLMITTAAADGKHSFCEPLKRIYTRLYSQRRRVGGDGTLRWLRPEMRRVLLEEEKTTKENRRNKKKKLNRDRTILYCCYTV